MDNVRKLVGERDSAGSLLVKARESLKMAFIHLPPIPEDEAESVAAEEYSVDQISRSLSKQFMELPLEEDPDSELLPDVDLALQQLANVDDMVDDSGNKAGQLEWPSPLPSDGSASDESSISSTNEIIPSSTSSGDEFQLDSHLIHHPSRRRRRRSSNSI